MSPTTAKLQSQIVPHWLQVGSYSVSRGMHGETFDRVIGSLEDPRNRDYANRLHLLRSNETAIPWYASYFLSRELSGVLPSNYQVFGLLPRRSIILNLNLDQYATSLLPFHVVLEPHGHVPVGLRKVFTLKDLSEYVEFEVPLPWDDAALLIRPEPASINRREEYQYLVEQWKHIRFVLIIGYSFSRFGQTIDDIETFRFITEMARHYRTDVALIDPNPDETLEILQTAIRRRVTVGKYFWNHLSKALIFYILRFGTSRIAKDAI